MRRRVVITGIGAVSGLGIGLDQLWQGLVGGRSCLKPITRLDASGFACTLAGEIEGLAAKDFVPKHYRKAVKVMARDSELAVAAASLAVQDAGLVTRAALGDPDDNADTSKLTYPPVRLGCQIGAGLIAADSDEIAAAMVTATDEDGRFSIHAWGGSGDGDNTNGGMGNLTPLWLLKYLPNMLACHVTIIHGAEGPSNTITCAEASGLLSIGESARVIERGDADACFSGGGESKLSYMGMLRIQLAGRLANCGKATDAGTLLKPYDPHSAGTILGEGAGILILEEAEAAQRRGSKVYAEIRGFGGGHADPFDAAPDVDEGILAAIENALDDAGVSPGEIDAIIPGALGIPAVDAGEAGALRRVFGDHLAEIPVVALPPAIGNLMAGMGGVQAAVAAKCVAEQRLPAHVRLASTSAGPSAVPSEQRTVRNVLVCTPSLGGQCAAAVLSRA